MLRPATGLPWPRLAARDAAAEAVAGIVQRPGRAALTMLGTVLGVGAFVAVLGMTATGAGQISHQFTVLEDTTVTVQDNGPANNVAPPDSVVGRASSRCPSRTASSASTAARTRAPRGVWLYSSASSTFSSAVR